MILLDTCAIIWDSLSPGKLSKKAKVALEESDGEIAISSISFWEISMLNSLGKLKLGCDLDFFFETMLEAKKYYVCEISPKIATQSVRWGAEINKDPADRIISATSYCNKWKLITADKNLRKAKSVSTIW